MTIMVHELTVYDDGRVDGYEDIHIRGGDYCSHVLRFGFLNGIPGTSVRMKLQQKGRAAVFYDADTTEGDSVSFAPTVWEAGDVWLQLETVDGQTDGVWNSMRFMITVRESIYGAVEAPKLMDTSGATATPEDLKLGETAYVNGKKIIGTVKPQAGYNALLNSVRETVMKGPCLLMGDINVSISGDVVPGNIRKGVRIAGVTGTYEGGNTEAQCWTGLKKYEKKGIVVVSNEYISGYKNEIFRDENGKISDYPEDIGEILMAELTIKAPAEIAATKCGGMVPMGLTSGYSEATNGIFLTDDVENQGTDSYWFEISGEGLDLWNVAYDECIVDFVIYYRPLEGTA